MSTYRALWLTPELHAKLAVHCRQNKIKIGVLTTQLVKDYLEQQKTVAQTTEVAL